MGRKRKVSEQMLALTDGNRVVFRDEAEYDSTFGIMSDDDRRDWTKKYPMTFMLHITCHNPIPYEMAEQLGWAVKDDIELSPERFGTVNVIIKINSGVLWGLYANICAGNDEEHKRISEAMKKEPFSRTNALFNQILADDAEKQKSKPKGLRELGL